MGQGTAVTRARLAEGMTCEIEDGPWRLTVGMSEKSGGAGAGPDPGVLGRGALASCLAVGYALWASKAGVPIRTLEVEIHADYDVRGEYGLADISPSYSQIRYVVHVDSDAPQAELEAALDEADANSPYLSIFRDAQDVRRELRITNGAS
ncbi:MAG: OsmC family protein [Planctomycetota bacterium]